MAGFRNFSVGVVGDSPWLVQCDDATVSSDTSTGSGLIIVLHRSVRNLPRSTAVGEVEQVHTTMAYHCDVTCLCCWGCLPVLS